MTHSESLAYVAGLMDGEAYFGIKKTPAYKCQGRATPGYIARIQIRMVDEPAIKFIAETLGGWYYPEKAHSSQGKPLFCYQCANAAAETILKSVLPFLRVKRAQADTILQLRDWQSHGAEHRTKVIGTRSFPNGRGTAWNRNSPGPWVAGVEAVAQICPPSNRALGRVGRPNRWAERVDSVVVLRVQYNTESLP